MEAEKQKLEALETDSDKLHGTEETLVKTYKENEAIKIELDQLRNKLASSENEKLGAAGKICLQVWI